MSTMPNTVNYDGAPSLPVWEYVLELPGALGVPRPVEFLRQANKRGQQCTVLLALRVVLDGTGAP